MNTSHLEVAVPQDARPHRPARPGLSSGLLFAALVITPLQLVDWLGGPALAQLSWQSAPSMRQGASSLPEDDAMGRWLARQEGQSAPPEDQLMARAAFDAPPLSRQAQDLVWQRRATLQRCADQLTAAQPRLDARLSLRWQQGALSVSVPEQTPSPALDCLITRVRELGALDDLASEGEVALNLALIYASP